MGARRGPGILVPLCRIVASLALFAGVFLTLFWTPGVLLALFALAYAADSRTLSTALDPATRHAQNSEAARHYSGGWLDSIFRPT
jgi:hypothetical protein